MIWILHMAAGLISALVFYHLSYSGPIDGVGMQIERFRPVKWQSARLEIWRSEIRIVIQVQIYLLKSEISILQSHKLCFFFFQLAVWFKTSNNILIMLATSTDRIANHIIPSCFLHPVFSESSWPVRSLESRYTHISVK